jgi:hypothetical protein
MSPFDRAQAGREQIEQAILELLTIHRSGLRNSEIANHLGIATPKGQPQRNRFTWEIVMRLVERGDVFQSETADGKPLYTLGK